MATKSIIRGVAMAAEAAGYTSPKLELAVKVLSKLNKTYTELQGYDSKCAALHSRLKWFAHGLRKLPPDTPEAQSLVSRLIPLINKFDKAVHDYSDRKFYTRWAYMGKFDESINNYNDELDHIITMATKTVQDSKNYDEIMKSCPEFKEDFAGLVEETENTGGPEKINQHFENMSNEDITRFLMELKRNFTPNQNSQELALLPIDSAIQKIADIAHKDVLKNKVVETPEMWTITEDEVILREQIDSRGAARIYIGEWGGVQVAIKKFSGHHTGNPVFTEHLRIWRTLLHPNVAQLYGAGTDSSRAPFLVYEYASRRSLDKCGDTMSSKDTWKTLYQAALGLTYLHKNHVVHGNLSCSKLLVTEKGDVKLFGFGSSRINTNNETNNIKTEFDRNFAAPECLGIGPDGQDCGCPHGPHFQSDVYSLGLTIIEAVSKETPYKDLPDNKMKDLKRKNMLPKPRDLDEGAWALVKQMCVCDPSQRPSLPYVTEKLERYAQ